MGSNNLTSYEKKVFMIEGFDLSEADFKKLKTKKRGIVPYELTAFNFINPNSKNRKFLEIELANETDLDILANRVKESVITWVGGCPYFPEYIEIKNIWKGKVEIFSNMSYIHVKHNQILSLYPFSYYLDLGKEIMAAKEYKFYINNDVEIINLSFQLSKL